MSLVVNFFLRRRDLLYLVLLIVAVTGIFFIRTSELVQQLDQWKYLILAVLIAFLLMWDLVRNGWKKIHAASIGLGIIWSFFIFTVGVDLIKNALPSLDAAQFFVIYWLIQWVGTATISAYAAYYFSKDKQIAKRIIRFWIGIGLFYTGIDNIGLGPNAVGATSPYRSYGTLIGLPINYYAEDLAFGALLEAVLKISPFSDLAAFLTYVVYSVIIIYAAIWLLGLRELERFMFGHSAPATTRILDVSKRVLNSTIFSVKRYAT